jgi:hypothetical protein
MIPAGLAAVADRMPSEVRCRELTGSPSPRNVGQPAPLAGEHAALKLARHIAEGDAGAVRRFVSESSTASARGTT